MAVNIVCIAGNLTRDAEVKATPSGVTVLEFGVAVNERRKNASGEWEDHPNYIDCAMFGSRAEKIGGYLTKGKKVAIQGKLHYSSWQDQSSGKKRSKLSVTVDDIEFMSGRSNSMRQSYSDDDIEW